MDAKRHEVDGAGCLVMLGSLLLIPLLFVVFWISRENLGSALTFIQWTSVPAFFKSAWRWVHQGGSLGHYFSIASILVMGFCTLLWQWIVFLMGWRTIISPSRLWAVSSAFFIIVIAAIGFVFYESGISILTWLMLTLVASTIPGAFLAITLPLWLSSYRPEDGSATNPTQQ